MRDRITRALLAGMLYLNVSNWIDIGPSKAPRAWVRLLEPHEMFINTLPNNHQEQKSRISFKRNSRPRKEEGTTMTHVV